MKITRSNIGRFPSHSQSSDFATFVPLPFRLRIPQMNIPTLVVGVGSDHGDDQIGWTVARSLLQRLRQDCEIRLARSPSDLLGWLEGRERLVLCDACRGKGPPGTVYRWPWPCSGFSEVGWSGTHDLALTAVLALAEQFGWLPRTVVIWGIDVTPSESSADHSRLCAQAVARVADGIEADLNGNSGGLETTWNRSSDSSRAVTEREKFSDA